MSGEIRWHLVGDLELRGMLNLPDKALAAAALEEHERRRRMAGQAGQKNLKFTDTEESE